MGMLGVKKKRPKSDVELNVTAMLDLAFQLLAFFILTFKPAPVEGDVLLRMAPPRPTTIVKNGQAPGGDPKNTNPVQGLTSLTITVTGTPSGDIDALAVGEARAAGLEGFEAKLKTILADEGAGFDQVLLQVSGGLRYRELMRVIDVCTRQKLPNGKKLSKLSFVELPSN
jgi:biopolymer transport protein ExbD